MRTAFKLPFRLAGIPLYVDLSFLIILPLLVWMIAGNFARVLGMMDLGAEAQRVGGGWMPLLLGLVAALGLFACVVLHELGHSLTARAYGVKVRRITLWALGGVAEFEEIPRQRGAEAVVAIAGPLVSFALAGVFFALALGVPRTTMPATWLVVTYLFQLNLILGLFNLLPALPLDGGRILRSLLALKLPYLRATVVSGTIAKVIAIGMGLWGLGLLDLLVFGDYRGMRNLWMIVLAFFVYSASNAEMQQAFVVEMLKGVSVPEVMSRDVRTAPAWMSVGELYGYMMAHQVKGFPVVDHQGRLIGLVGMEQLQGVDPATPVWRVMSTELVGINHRASALDAFAQMSKNGFGQLIVFDEANNMVGVLSQRDLIRAIRDRMAGVEDYEAASPMAVRRSMGPFAPPPDYMPTSQPGQSPPVTVTVAPGEAQAPASSAGVRG